VSKKDTKELWKILNKFNNKNNKENQKDISLLRSSMVFLMYSFNIPSFPKALPFLNLSTTFFISFSVIGLFRN
jgi:hypothetical protein